jgi:hypothetical protein
VSAAPLRWGVFIVASAVVGVLVPLLPALSNQLAVVFAAATVSATLLLSGAHRVLNPVWIIVPWLYLVGPIGVFLLSAGIGLSPAAVLTLAPAPFALAAVIMRPASLDRIVFLAPLFALVIYAVLSLAWTPAPVTGATKLNHWILAGILPVAYILVLTPASSGVSWPVIGTVAFISTVALIVVGSDSALYPGRASLLDANPIWAARAAFIGALVVLFGPFNKWIKVGVAPIIILGGLITVSLGPALGMIAGVWAGVAASLRIADRSDRRTAIGWAALGLVTATGLAIVVVGEHPAGSGCATPVGR